MPGRRPPTLAEALWAGLTPAGRQLAARVLLGAVLLAVLAMAQCVFGPLPRRR